MMLIELKNIQKRHFQELGITGMITKIHHIN